MSPLHPLGLEHIRVAYERFARDRDAALPDLLALYHPEIRFRDPLQETRGIEAFRRAMERFAKVARELEMETGEGAVSGDTLFLRWTLRFRPPLAARPLVVEGASYFRLDDGLIADQRDYWDLAESVAASIPGGRALWRRLCAVLA